MDSFHIYATVIDSPTLTVLFVLKNNHSLCIQGWLAKDDVVNNFDF